MYQSITIVGNVGRDPEMRYTGDGIPATSFSVAVSNKYGDKEKTVWFRCTAWRKQAELCNTYLKKGSKVLIVGEIEEPRIYTAPDGTPRTSLEITVQTVKFMSPKSEAEPTEKPAPQKVEEDETPIPF